ncbi:hypothetical protein G3O08_14500 [Cryomorpha ignava]|uniref:Uncharacterized protein n=1 Tax=Cryomorpha ignava TaxID=101383 RepID=A0A7K3WTA2_9FLAO|nr:hypothetical protein [Cryomorpha ignava]NEN24714.1 hypothetical protein [Cryomorpha ignava]
MKSLKIFLLAGILVASCTNDPVEEQDSWPVDFDALVALNCRAIELRKARFATADSLRLDMDSIKASMNQSDFEKYQNDFETRKNALLSESNALADTIRLRMKGVMSDLGPDRKRVFNDSLQATLKREGCE